MYFECHLEESKDLPKFQLSSRGDSPREISVSLVIPAKAGIHNYLFSFALRGWRFFFQKKNQNCRAGCLTRQLSAVHSRFFPNQHNHIGKNLRSLDQLHSLAKRSVIDNVLRAYARRSNSTQRKRAWVAQCLRSHATSLVSQLVELL